MLIRISRKQTERWEIIFKRFYETYGRLGIATKTEIGRLLSTIGRNENVCDDDDGFSWNRWCLRIDTNILNWVSENSMLLKGNNLFLYFLFYLLHFRKNLYF